MDVFIGTQNLKVYEKKMKKKKKKKSNKNTRENKLYERPHLTSTSGKEKRKKDLKIK